MTHQEGKANDGDVTLQILQQGLTQFDSLRAEDVNSEWATFPPVDISCHAVGFGTLKAYRPAAYWEHKSSSKFRPLPIDAIGDTPGLIISQLLGGQLAISHRGRGGQTCPASLVVEISSEYREREVGATQNFRTARWSIANSPCLPVLAGNHRDADGQGVPFVLSLGITHRTESVLSHHSAPAVVERPDGAVLEPWGSKLQMPGGIEKFADHTGLGGSTSASTSLWELRIPGFPNLHTLDRGLQFMDAVADIAIDLCLVLVQSAGHDPFGKSTPAQETSWIKVAGHWG
ncbi:hypothetical protein P154DRAFT_538785 [Amniculicola lignicola CBS 123094]|uniref:Uncharacterized protein n=1 Tax=Amniculicola lignicola CBS 123094 TaxID=1392246 RepID=A0A6A5W3A7_9PLEO|nr:hypothetical protein P154DRAFT_538785 [Amniculicola lignicola CBS 123094]